MDETKGLPERAEKVAEFLAQAANADSDHLRSADLDKLKADLNSARDEWLGVDRTAFGARLEELGIGADDVLKVDGLLEKAQAGRFVRPRTVGKDSRFDF
jgi:hypothetical protein